MKILFLLFSLILLSVQGAAGERGRGEGGATTCWRQRGFCSYRSCPHGTRVIGSCSPGLSCCKG
uniref:Beta-defensin-like domain-containing protein n=1 Tax=Malurus cyaneus samueli TaxID=2593467 RepID=A0A8C5U4B7_9PASS